MSREDEELSTLYVTKRAFREVADASRLTGRAIAVACRGVETIVSGIKEKKMLQKIESENAKKRNVQEAGTQTAAQLNMDPFGNILLTGQIDRMELPILSSIFEGLHSQQCPVVVLHRENRQIESIVQQLGGIVINAANKRYDPFYNRSNFDIYKIVSSVCQGALSGIALKPEALQYITSMYMYIRQAKKSKLTLALCANCPHGDLLQRMTQEFASGKITQLAYDEMSQAYMAGQGERFALMSVFEELRKNGNNICFDGKKGRPYNIRDAISTANIIAISVPTPIALDMIACEIDQEIIGGHRMVVCFDQIFINKNKTILSILSQKTLNTVGGGSIIATNDMMNMCSGDEKLFSDICSTMDTILLARHPNGRAVEQWSAFIGEYEKTERSWGNDSGSMRAKPWELFAGKHSGRNQTFSLKRERILKQEDITSLRDQEFYFISKSRQQILKTSI